jgi:hypothetical protein
MTPTAFLSAGRLQHPQLGLCDYRLTQVSEHPDTQVREVIGYMRDYAIADAHSPEIALDAQRAAATGDPILDTWRWLSRKQGSRGMQFQRDEETGAQLDSIWDPVVETLIRPRDQAGLAIPIGDCDDFAMYGAAHLLYKDVPCAYVTIAADERDPRWFSHVYVAAYPKTGQYAGVRVVLDLSHGDYPGWEHGGAYRLEEWPIRTSMSWTSLALAAAAAGATYLLVRKERFA